MICITFDNFGCGAGKLPPCRFPTEVPPSEWDEYNEIGLALGHPRILGLLERLGVRTTFFCEGISAALHPREMLRWKEQGHEIALHGWKHETWSSIDGREREDRLVGLGVEAIRELLGESPVGFRPPGLEINAWTDDVMERHGIRYLATSPERPDLAARFSALGFGDAASRPASPEFVKTRLALLPTGASMIDAIRIRPAHGGLCGTLDAETAYREFFELAVAHERASPADPWVLVVHPFISGNRAWTAFDGFLQRLVAEVGASAFVTGREAVDRGAH